MAKLKDIKEKYKEYNLTIIDYVKMIDPSKNGKYMNLLMETISKSTLKRYCEDNGLGITLNAMNSHLMEVIIEYLGGRSVVNTIKDFENYCNSGHIIDKDIQNYKTVDDIEYAVFNTKNMLEGKSKPKQDIIFRDDDWCIVKPLNFMSSRKYGSGTKWCTTSIDRQTYFYEYSHDGVFLYVISLKTDVKWAVLYQSNKLHNTKDYDGPTSIVDPGDVGELSWWDVKDNRHDSYFITIPEYVEKAAMDHILSQQYSNMSYFDDETLVEMNDYNCGGKESELLDAEEVGGPYSPTREILAMPEPIEPPTDGAFRIDDSILRILENQMTRDESPE